ncbi:Hypothetical protein CINCED_3A019099 [Cinara cedri]|uniref:Uncharacterized protein n=1 Tax=Cinara cedri TaxID=506608 RepID=A0A5E4NMC7_9HEMI|nr:Hypothetical protein CINCED_3A019099 [Cinara cedri]
MTIQYEIHKIRIYSKSDKSIIANVPHIYERQRCDLLSKYGKKVRSSQPTLSTLFSAVSKQVNDGASYNISLLIAKTGKPHTIGEDLILPAIKKVITTVLHKPAADINRKILLSNSSVQRRIDEMAENIENHCAII